MFEEEIDGIRVNKGKYLNFSIRVTQLQKNIRALQFKKIIARFFEKREIYFSFVNSLNLFSIKFNVDFFD